MPNPQLHVAVGMIGSLVILGIVFLINKKFFMTKKLYMIIPLIILFGSALSMVPDVPELAKSYPSVFSQLGIDKYDKPVWNTPPFNLFFLHPAMDSVFLGDYDNIGLFLTIMTYFILAFTYYSMSRRRNIPITK